VSEELSSNLRPGKVLKALREERKLSLKSVADKTKIPIKKLEWIDNDEYSKFEAPVFVRGYLRSYAKLVDADADNLVGLYDQIVGESLKDELGHQLEDLDLRSANQVALSNYAKNFVSKTPLWSVVAVLVVCWLLFMFFAGGDESESASPALVQATKEDSRAEISVSENSTVMASISQEVTQNSSSSNETNSITSEQTYSSQTTQPQEPLQTSEQGLQTQMAQNDLQANQTEESQFASVVSDRSELSFQFSDECWVEVRDANDDVIFADIKNKGDNLRLFGSAPFNIMLGNARATELSIDGSPVELRVSGGRKTLRLTVFAN